MFSPLRLLLALLAGLVMAGTAYGAIGSAGFTPTPFTKATPGAGTAVQATVSWSPALFLPPTPADVVDVTVANEAGGSPQTYRVPGTSTSLPVFVTDGASYRITIFPCQIAAPCASLAGTSSDVSVSAVTRVDATPPAGTVRIAGGAAFTNRRAVSLALTAADPLIGGVAGTSSGVTQVAVDVDGNGTYPCSPLLLNPPPDQSGCAQAFAPSVDATLSAGDGPKTLAVTFGDGARIIPVPCTSTFCVVTLGSPILGNASAAATDTIVLDTLSPTALATQDRTVVRQGGTVSFDATGSVDQNPAVGSGVDLATASWDFKDGTPRAVGARVAHAFDQVGTFLVELRVRDRAGNLSDARQLAVTVDPPPGRTAAGAGRISGVRGSAAFRIDRLRVNARYRAGRLRGSIVISGRSTAAGRLRLQVRRGSRARVVARLSTRIPAGAFRKTLRLPARLAPGTYRVALVGPGGTLRATLRLTGAR